jgi:hypothetical protein
MPANSRWDFNSVLKGLKNIKLLTFLTQQHYVFCDERSAFLFIVYVTLINQMFLINFGSTTYGGIE